MTGKRRGPLGRLRDLNTQANGYAQVRLRNEAPHLTKSGRSKPVVLILVTMVLKLYYVFSAPVVTFVARRDRLLSLARMLRSPTKKIVKKLVG